jgi:hypothetical protein
MAFDTSCRSILLTMSKVLSGIGFHFFLKQWNLTSRVPEEGPREQG